MTLNAVFTLIYIFTLHFIHMAWGLLSNSECCFRHFLRYNKMVMELMSIFWLVIMLLDIFFFLFSSVDYPTDVSERFIIHHAYLLTNVRWLTTSVNSCWLAVTHGDLMQNEWRHNNQSGLSSSQVTCYKDDFRPKNTGFQVFYFEIKGVSTSALLPFACVLLDAFVGGGIQMIWGVGEWGVEREGD